MPLQTDRSKRLSATDTNAIDRISIRQRPAGSPIMHQTWDKLLFLHWPVEVDVLRRLLPKGLEIDTWNGTAWIGVTPFTIRGIRPPMMPSLPLVSASHELNVRTYVHRDGVPGVWFFSLDASNRLAVRGARVGFSLPYFDADMRLETGDDRIQFRSVRTHRKAAPAEFHAAWQVGPRLPEAVPGTREFFLIERYCLYSASAGRLYHARIHHRPWPLRRVQVERLNSSMLQANGLPEPQQAPLVHAQADPLEVWVWPPKRFK